MKKVLSMLLAIVMVFSLLPISAFAAETGGKITFTTDFTNDLGVGDTFTVTATLSENPGIASFANQFKYNDQVLAFKGFKLNSRGKVDTEVFLYDAPVWENTTATFVMAVDYNNTDNGMLYVGEFEIIAEEGELGLGLTTTEFGQKFTFADVDGKDIMPELDFSAITGLTVGGKAVGPEMPEDAPFTAITTDAGPIVAVEYVEDLEFNYSTVPYYIVTIPADATTAYVTAPDQVVMEDMTTNEVMATGYAANLEDMSSPLYVSYNYEETADGPKVEIPMNMTASDFSGGEVELCFFSNDEYNPATHAFGIEDASYACLGLIAFQYAGEAEEIYSITIDPNLVGGTITASNEDGEPLTEAAAGDYVFVTVTPASGYTGNAYTINGQIANDYIFQMPEEDVVLSATFTAIHTCTYDQEVADEKYLKSAATCQSAAVYYKSCECELFDNSETAETFTSGTAVEHSFGENGKCQWCETYTITVADFENGTVTAEQYAEAGSAVTLTVAPAEGYMLDTLSVMNGETAVEVGEGHTFTMPAAPVNVSATFKEIPPENYVITVTESANGTVVANPTAAAQGTTVTLTVTPAEGYELESLTVMAGETAVEVAENNTFEMPAANVTVTATFEKIPTYAISSDGTIVGGTVTVTNEDGEPITEAAEGETVMISAVASEGYTFVSAAYSYGDQQIECANNAFTMPAAPVTVTAVFKNNAPTVEPNPITKIEVSHPSIKEVTDDETGTASLVMEIVSGVSEKLDLNITLRNSELEATQEISWASTNSTVAWVENNTLMTGTVTEPTYVILTATAVEKTATTAMIDGEGSDALLTLKVTVNPAGEGYTVNMGPDKNVVANETIQIPVTVAHSDSAVTGYKSYEFTFQYDPALLTLLNKSPENDEKDVTIEDNNGTVTVRRYGEALNVGEAAITLEFSAKKTCETNVTLTSAKVGTSDDAKGENIPDAQIVDNITLVTVSGYTVQLPDEFDGEKMITPGEDYTFTAKDLNYNYTITAKIGDETLTVTGSGTVAAPYNISADQIDGNIVITTEKEGKEFDVAITENADMAPAEGFKVGEDAAQYMVDYKAVLTPTDGYEYGVEITIDNVEYPCTPDENGVYTIEGSDITGDINIAVTKTPVTVAEHNVSFSGNGVEDLVEGYAVKVAHEADYSFSLKEAENYAYTVTASMGGTAVTPVKAEEANEDGSYTYTIAKVTADLAIQIEKSDLKVAVNEYVGLDGKTVFLVTATQTLPEGKTLAYGGSAMYVKSFQVEGSEEMVQKYSWLVEVVEGETLTVEAATAQIAVTEATSTVLEQTYNVNESSALDINDAQLVYDLYNNVYQSIETVGMQKFLRADVNGSGNINVQDASAVVTAIIAAKSSSEKA